MEFITKRTSDLTIEEKQSLVNLFNEVFDHNRSITQFEDQFFNNCEGNSFHTLVLKDGEIIGSNTMVPSVYLVKGKQYRFVNSVDTMINKKCRGIENFYDMIKESFSYCENLGYDIVYGFPNDNSYPLFKGCKFMFDVDSLYTYCLPYRIGGIKPNLRLLNWASTLFCECWLGVCKLIASSDISQFSIEKYAASYNETRYKRLDADYSHAVYKGSEFYYKISEFEGIHVAFLIDVVKKSPKNFCSAVHYILKEEKERFDIILYVGYLPFDISGLVKLPHKYEPKSFNFTTGILNKKVFKKEDLQDIRKWDINLSNYDLI